MDKEYGFRESNRDRKRRADSWHERSKAEQEPYAKFIFLWIAFNALYGQKDREEDKSDFCYIEEFLNNLNDHTKSMNLQDQDLISKDMSLKNIINENNESIEATLNNIYIDKRFWNRGIWRYEKKWEELKAKKKQESSENKSNPEKRLKDVLRCLYTLRNQVFHGCTTNESKTKESKFSHSQVKHGVKIMEALVPVALNIVKDKIVKRSDTDFWGEVEYPRFRDKAQEY